MGTQKIIDIREKYCKKRKNADGIDEIREATGKELKRYKNLIEDFFSDIHSQKKIKTLYFRLKNKQFEDRKICCPNLKKIFEIYREYNKGMLQFVNEILKNSWDSYSDKEDYEIKLKRACEQDSIFIVDLFCNKEQWCDDISLQDAMEHFEIIIKLPDILETEKKWIETVENCEGYLCEKSIELYCYSISHFFPKLLIEISTLFYKIWDETEHSFKKQENDQMQLF